MDGLRPGAVGGDACPTAAAAITGLRFGGLHLPLYVDGGTVWDLMGTTALIAVTVAIPIRIVFGWLYHRTGSSVLLVALTRGRLGAGRRGS